jgi:Uma2 family endonuclease
VGKALRHTLDQTEVSIAAVTLELSEDSAHGLTFSNKRSADSLTSGHEKRYNQLRLIMRDHAMEAVVTQVGMPLDEFIRLYNAQPFEIIRGERKPKLPNVSRHDETSRTAFIALHLYGVENKLGEAMMESPFVLSYTSNWVTGSRTADIMFYTSERITAYREADPDYGSKPYILVPDLVIEVVSPNDNLTELSDKVDQYLLDGVKLVWVIDPQKQKVSVYTLTAQQPFTKQEIQLTGTDTLSGAAIIPGLELPVSRL